MIFFVPRYDPATNANWAIAVPILSMDCYPLLDQLATRPELLARLAATEEPLFAMCHGRQDRLLAQGGEIGLQSMDLEKLGPRSVFAFACHTATSLGSEAAGIGAVWWGYTGSITAPDSSPRALPLFVRIFAYIRDAFAVLDSASRQEILQRIADLCHEAESEVDDLLAADADLDATSAYLCLLQIWQRLRVWEPGAAEPLQHPDAPPPALLF